MAGGQGEGKSEMVLGNRIACIKYTLFCFNIVSWMIGAAMFGLSIWIRVEPGFEEWVEMLFLQNYYIGVYILIIASVIVMVVSLLGCCSALMENVLALTVFVGTQILSFIVGLAGAAVLLDHGTRDSSLQPMIRTTMTRLIANSHHTPSAEILRIIHENIGCCGADGASDYIRLRQPLPSECRDTITGNAFFHGCVDELTWFVQDKSAWCAGLAMALCMIHVINAVMSIIMIQAVRREENEARSYKR